MAFDIYIPSIIGLPPPYNIYLCDPGPINCVLVGASVTVPYTISPVPPQFQGPNQDVYIYAESLDPNYSGSCEPNNILNPDPLPDCICYNITANANGDVTWFDCVNGFPYKQTLTSGQVIDICSFTVPTGNATITQNGLCINGLCP